jgi:hypothetical protein
MPLSRIFQYRYYLFSYACLVVENLLIIFRGEPIAIYYVDVENLMKMEIN